MACWPSVPCPTYPDIRLAAVTPRGMARRLDPRIRLNWRILLPGKLPAYLQQHDFLVRDMALPQPIEAGRIGPRAAGPTPDPGFSARIREGVPMPVQAPVPG